MNRHFFIVLFFVSLASILSFVSFIYIGKVTPDLTATYGHALEPGQDNLCWSLARNDSLYRNVEYSNGFPFQIIGKAEVNIACRTSDQYTPPLTKIVTTWQFYANTFAYAISLLVLVRVSKKVKSS